MGMEWGFNTHPTLGERRAPVSCECGMEEWLRWCVCVCVGMCGHKVCGYSRFFLRYHG